MADAGDATRILQSKESKRILIVLGYLFIYSVAMFTMPFVAFYTVHHLLTLYFPGEAFFINAWSAGAAVVVVNLVIFSYVYKAWHEKEYDADGNEIDQQVYPSAPAPQAPTEQRSTLNLKHD